LTIFPCTPRYGIPETLVGLFLLSVPFRSAPCESFSRPQGSSSCPPSVCRADQRVVGPHRSPRSLPLSSRCRHSLGFGPAELCLRTLFLAFGSVCICVFLVVIVLAFGSCPMKPLDLRGTRFSLTPFFLLFTVWLFSFHPPP